ncbi:hypothetical protein ACILE2_09255 [Capnocytophaga canimorsus]|uniref:hypothetical protein n=1 Tax=Capnocytophaga canimorsus TaxID=28188 RepID=UPI0037D4D3CD
MESLFKFIVSAGFVIGILIYGLPILGALLFALLAIIYNNWELFVVLGTFFLLFFIVLVIKNNRKSQNN